MPSQPRTQRCYRPRDNQRSLVYAWERRSSSQLQFHDGVALRRRALHTPTFSTLDECDAYLQGFWPRERGRYGLSGTHTPRIERPHRGQKRALAHPDHRITLPRWARSPWIILHEAAHHLTPWDEPHGPRFVGVLIGLLARHHGYDASELMALADEMGVRYHVRSIGLVPTITMSERLHRLLPTTEMEAAFSLGVSWRQVRAASLTLLRTGRARWLRGKLLPVPLMNAGICLVR